MSGQQTTELYIAIINASFIFVGVIILAYLFRDAIMYVLKKRNLEIQTPKASLKITEPPANNLQDDNLNEPTEETSNEESRIIDTELSNENDYFSAMFTAFDNDKPDEAAITLERYIKFEPDESKRLEFKVVYNYLRCTRTNNSEALNELIQFTKNELVSAYAYSWLGLYYEYINDDKNASESYLNATNKSIDEKDIANNANSYSQNAIKIGQSEKALSELLYLLPKIKSDDAKSLLYESLSKLYEAERNNIFEIITLERALKYKTNDIKIRFNLSYAYAQRKFNVLSLKHYKSYLKISPDNSMARNNLGVAYKRLGMKFRAVKNYQRAADLDNSLAYSNLAYLQMNSGFSENASKLLSEALKIKDSENDISAAITKLDKTETEEKEKEENMDKEGNIQQAFILAFGHAHFTKTENHSSPFSGTWKGENLN